MIAELIMRFKKRERKRAGKAAVTGGRRVCARFKPRKGSIPDVQG